MTDGAADDSHRISISSLNFDHGIPKAVRDHGKVVDPTLLEPGDLILVCKRKPAWISRKIQHYQDKMFPSEHSSWHHAICLPSSPERFLADG